jgi:hypothetical protein
MSASLPDLGARADALPTPDFDPAALIRQAEVRSRNRRASWVAAGVAVALVAAGGATLGRGQDRAAPPAGRDENPEISTVPARQVTYGDGYWPTTTIRYGEHTVYLPGELSVRPADTGVVHMDVTDDGVAFTIASLAGEGQGVWFTDGVTTRRIGEIDGYLGIRASMAVMSGTAGSLVAWIEESTPGRAEIVVYDTNDREEVARVAPPSCHASRTATCALDAVVGDHVYFIGGSDRHRRRDMRRLDVSTHELERVSAAEAASDLAGMPRGLVLGDSADTGRVTNGYGVVFAVRGERLVPTSESLAPSDPYNSTTSAFDTGTHQRLQFHLPAGHRSAAEEFTAFEWLDDDRLALMNAANSWRQTTGEILVCRISTSRCNVAVPAKSTRDDEPRIAPHLPLPG